MTVYVDSSAFYAAVDDGDASCERARSLLAAQERLVTSDHVLAESWLLLQRRLGYDVAERFWEGIRASVTVEHVRPVDLENAWAAGEVFADQRFSLVDRTSFAVMQRLGVHRVISFDDDFAIFRFGRKRDRAFEMMR